MQGRVGKDRVDRLLDGEVVRVGDPKVGARSRCRAASIIAGSESMPITVAPVPAIFAANSPVPQPRSKTVSPGCGFSQSKSSAP